ncbi:MAG: hypothetical protein JXR96_03795, partial [Deltaproteobacteria bacterium]|nr:hypothetical protein [Deltaproteobacteria bacterium]
MPVVAVAVECDESIMGRGDRLAQELERLLVFRLEHGVAVEKAIPVGAGSARDLARLRALGASLLVRCVLGVELGRVQ